MATYAAVACLKHKLSLMLKYWDVFMPPPLLYLIKSTDSELKSFQDFLQRLDSNKRKRINASLDRIAKAIRKHDYTFMSFAEQIEEHEERRVNKNHVVESEILETADNGRRGMIGLLGRMAKGIRKHDDSFMSLAEQIGEYDESEETNMRRRWMIVLLSRMAEGIRKHNDSFTPLAEQMQEYEERRETKYVADRRRKRMIALIGRIGKEMREHDDSFMSLAEHMGECDEERQEIYDHVAESKTRKYANNNHKKRLNGLLGRVAKVICKHDDSFMSHVEDIGEYDEERREKEDHMAESLSILLQHLKQYTRSCVEALKAKLEYHSMAKDEVVSCSKNSKMVGLSDQYNILKQDILGDWEEGPIFTLLGMAGIGKTALAKEVYQDLDILEWFECRAWVELGREYQPKEIVKAMLAQVDPYAHKILAGGYKGMVKYLKKSLKGKRYLIVLDNVWDFWVHNNMGSLFPHNRNGSRVLLTTRAHVVAHRPYTFPSFLTIRLLNEKESWDLLRYKVFGEDTCSPQLEKAGKKIAEKCDGLPLTIVIVADLLLKAGGTKESLWAEVATKRKHQLFIDAFHEVSKVLYPSYENLSYELKSCLLYLGIFPQNSKIPQSKLINLWIAEGVITSERNPEYHAAVCLQSLDLDCLVMVHERSSSSFKTFLIFKIKTCGLHSSWWHFCQTEARKSKLFHVLDCYEDGFGEGVEGQSRLSMHNNVLLAIKDVYNSLEENCASTVHSLLCFGSYLQYQVPICFGLKLLQKMDALNIRFYEFPLEVLELTKLKYLALTTNGKLPPSISKLLNLQLLIVHPHLNIKSNGSLSYLPVEIWNMKKLKHLEVIGYDLPDLGYDDTCLSKLSKLSGVSIGSCNKGVVDRIPNLRKLGIQIKLTPDVKETLRFSFQISHLKELESLKCEIAYPQIQFKVLKPPSLYSVIPQNLRKLSLNGLRYPWKEIKKITSLGNLGVLKLRCNAFEGPRWVIKHGDLRNLYYLLIEDLDLEELKGQYGSLKCLIQLKIKHCYKLKKLDPRHCRDISTFEVVDSNPLVEKGVKGAVNPYRIDHLSVHSAWEESTKIES